MIELPIPSLPGYFATNTGLIRTPSGSLMRGDKMGHKDRLYYQIDTPIGRKYVHVLVCEAFHGPKPTPEHHALHKDDNQYNFDPENLYWGTEKRNTEDRRKNGRMGCGQRKLTDEQVASIFDMRDRLNMTFTAIGEILRIHSSNVGDIYRHGGYRYKKTEYVPVAQNPRS